MSEIIYLKDILKPSKLSKKKSIKKNSKATETTKRRKADGVKSSLVSRKKKEDVK